MRLHSIFLMIVAISMLTSCQPEHLYDQLFNFPTSRVKSQPEIELKVESIHQSGARTNNCLICDSLIISPQRGDFLLNVTNLSTDESITSICRKGRSWNEPLSILPLNEAYYLDNELYTDIFSIIDGKFMTINISASIRDDKDSYSSVFQIQDKEHYSLLSYWRINESSIVAFDSKQDPYQDSLSSAPDYIVIDAKGHISRQYNLFNNTSLGIDNSFLAPKTMLTNVDCIKPDRKKLVMAMNYLPMISVLDLESGEAHGYFLDEYSDNSLNDEAWYFTDVQADDNHIFALFSGKEPYNDAGDDIPNTLMVFSWQGSLIGVIKLDHRFFQLNRVNDTLYLTHPNGSIAELGISDIIATLDR